MKIYPNVNKEFVETILIDYFSKIGWINKYNFVLEQKKELDHIIEAYIDMEIWKINIKIPEDFLEQFSDLYKNNNLGELIKFNKGIYFKPEHLEIPSNFTYSYTKEVYNFLAGVSLHEFGHSKECPIDNYNFMLIVQAVTTALEQLELYNDELLAYIINLFSDTIVNSINGLKIENQFFRNSIVTFYFSEIINSPQEDLAFLYFLLLNLIIFIPDLDIRNNFEEKILPKLNSNYKSIIKKLLHIFCPFEDIKNNLVIGVNLFEDERWKVINFLSETINWPKMAYDFTSIIAKFSSTNTRPNTESVPNSSFTDKLSNDKEFRQEILDNIIERKIIVNLKENQDTKTQNKQSDTHKGEFSSVKDIKDKDDSDNEIDEISQYPGEFDLDYGLSSFNDFEILDALYRNRIKKVTLKLKFENEIDKTPYLWTNREIMGENDNPMDMDPLNLYYIPNSNEMMIYKKASPLTINEVGNFNEKSFPNLALICDDSGSMDWDPINCSGRYDSVIITVYSLLEWLKEKKFASVIEYNLMKFSNTTRTTDWIDYFNIKKLHSLLFDYQGGGTSLDKTLLRNLLKEPKKKCIIMISDGEIENYKEIVKILNEHKNNLHFVLIQIEYMSAFAKSLDRKGFNVFLIEDIHSLPSIVINFVDLVYK